MLFTYVSLSYDLQLNKKEKEEEPEEDDIPLYADWDPSDWDKDGIIDALDQCPGTPVEALVDENGCPLDEDGDGVPDYLDEEAGTPQGNYVDEYGVTLTEEQIQRHWELYNDSTGYLHDFAELRTEINPLQKDKTQGELPHVVKGRSYVVIIGKEHKDVSANDLHEYLGYRDFKTIVKGDTVYYVLGEYDDIQDAVAAGKGLQNAGVDVKVIGKNNFESGNMTPVDDSVIEKVEKLNEKENKEIPTFSKTTQLYRVQLGAFSKKIDLTKSFRDIDDINYALGEDGLYHYYSGSFKTYEEAEVRRKDVAYKKGYKNAFVVAYEGQERVLLKDVVPEENLPDNYNPDKELTTFVEPYNPDHGKEENSTSSKVDIAKVKYSIMLGYFTGEVPLETYSVLTDAIGGSNIVPVKGFDGSTTYYLKNGFSSEADRDAKMDEYKGYGLESMKKVIEYEGKHYTPEEWQKFLDE